MKGKQAKRGEDKRGEEGKRKGEKRREKRGKRKEEKG